MVSKKGAIELSMTTIIVIVIGITLLSLGLVWVRGVFEDLEGLSGDAFLHAQDAITEIGQASQPLTIKPSELKLDSKSNDAIGVVVANLGADDATVTLRASTSDGGLVCGFLDGEDLVDSAGPLSVSSGTQQSEILGVVDKTGKIRLTSCKITAEGLEGDNTETLVINVQ